MPPDNTRTNFDSPTIMLLICRLPYGLIKSIIQIISIYSFLPPVLIINNKFSNNLISTTSKVKCFWNHNVVDVYVMWVDICLWENVYTAFKSLSEIMPKGECVMEIISPNIPFHDITIHNISIVNYHVLSGFILL